MALISWECGRTAESTSAYGILVELESLLVAQLSKHGQGDLGMGVRHL